MMAAAKKIDRDTSAAACRNRVDFLPVAVSARCGLSAGEKAGGWDSQAEDRST